MTDQEAITLLRDLCAVYSPSGQEAEAVALLVERANAAGLRARSDDVGNFVAERGDGPTTIVLLGHVDTVPSFITPSLTGRSLHARGAVDAKGPLAAFVSAAVRTTVPDDVRLVVVGAVEEEAPTSKGAHFVRECYAPAAVVIGEPSGGSGITLGYKGRVGVALTAQQAHAHTAARGRSLAARAAEWWTQLEADCEQRNLTRSVFECLDPHLADFQTTTDGFTDRVDLHGSLRLPVDADVDELRTGLEARAAGWGSVSIDGFVPPFKADRKNRLVAALIRAIRQAGLTPSFKLKTGTSDMNVVGPAWRCPIVAYGPGDSALDHTPDERVDLDEYLLTIRILSQALGDRLH